MKYQLIKELIELAEQFEQEQPESRKASLVDFVAWLNQHTVQNKHTFLPTMQAITNQFETVDSAIGRLMIHMTRYAKGYSKKALTGTPLVSIDDFAYLASLMALENPTKMELIERHIHEKTSGIEIIKRLLKNGLAEQFNDTEDKRSKRLKITPKGKEVMRNALNNMGKVATLVAGDLSREEKYQLLYILNKLSLFHNHIFLHERESSLDELLEEKFNQQNQP